MVVVFHVLDQEKISFVAGGAGVDLFFIISGFIIWTVSVEKSPQPAIFMLHRVIRVVPVYWIVMFAMVMRAILAPSAFSRLMVQPSHVLLSMAFIPHADPTGLPYPLLAVGWTLNWTPRRTLIYRLFVSVMAAIATFGALMVAISAVSGGRFGSGGAAVGRDRGDFAHAGAVLLSSQTRRCML